MAESLLVGSNFVSGICRLKGYKNFLKSKKNNKLFCIKKTWSEAYDRAIW